MQYTVSSSTPITVVSLNEAKANLRITHDLQDDMIQGMVNTAVAMSENYTGRAVYERSVVATCNDFVNNEILRETPVLGGVVITYRDTDNIIQTLDSQLYSVTESDIGEPVIFYKDITNLPSLYNSADAVRITYQIGYNNSTVPAPYKTFVFLMVTKLYEHPGDSALKYRSFANSILFPYKKQ